MRKILILFALSFMLISFASASFSLTDNLYGYWNFTKDYSSAVNGFTGTANGLVSILPNGIITNYSNYTGSSYVDEGSNTWISGNINWSYNFWVNKTLGDAGLISLNTSNPEQILYLQSGNLRLYNFDANDNTVVFDIAGFDSNISDGKWHMISITKSGNNWSLYLDSQLNTSASYSGFLDYGKYNLSFGYEGSKFLNGGLDEIGLWNRSLSSNEIRTLYNLGSGRTYPFAGTNTIVLDTPADGANYINNLFNASFNVTTAYNLSNSTLKIWNNAGSLVYNLTNTVTGAANTTNWTYGGLNVATYSWNAYTCYGNNTYSTCAYSINNNTFTYGYTINTNSFNSSTYETARESFITNVSLPASININSINLWYAGRSYSGSTVANGGNSYMLSSSIDIPTGAATNNWFWSLNLNNGQNINLSGSTQTASPITFSYCNASNNIPYVNFTFKDEQSLSNLNGTINTLSTSYYLGRGTVTKNYSYTNTSNASSFAFCFSPQSYNFNSSGITLAYSSSGYPQRNYLLTGILTNVTINQTLYLLSTSSGQLVNFQVLTSGGSSLPGASITVTSSLSSLGAIADSSGLAAFFLNPSTSYTITASYPGYPVSTLTLTPTLTQYSIVLGASTTQNSTAQQISNTLTGNLFVQPIVSQLTNDTTYSLNLTINSTTLALTLWGYTIYDQYGNVITQQSSTAAAGGVLNSLVNTGSNQSLTMIYYYNINGYQQNGTVTWTVINTAETGWSISNFLTDLKSYIGIGNNGSQTTPGIFGINAWSMNLIVFLIIFVTTGIMSYKFGLTSSTAISIMLFALIFIFDVALGLIYTPPALVNAVPHVTTVLMAIVMITIIIRENMY